MDEQTERPTMYQTCLLHARADRVFRTIVSSQLDQFKITLMEWLLLGVVKDAAKSGVTLSQIAKALDVSQPQITALMDKVASQNLVRQKVLRSDRRSRSVVLSTRGLKLVDNIEETIGAYLNEWWGNVPAEQLDAYLKTVRAISEFRPE